MALFVMSLTFERLTVSGIPGKLKSHTKSRDGLWTGSLFCELFAAVLSRFLASRAPVTVYFVQSIIYALF